MKSKFYSQVDIIAPICIKSYTKKFICTKNTFVVFDTTLLLNIPPHGALMNLDYQNPTANDRTSKSKKILKSIGLDIL